MFNIDQLPTDTLQAEQMNMLNKAIYYLEQFIAITDEIDSRDA